MIVTVGGRLSGGGGATVVDVGAGVVVEVVVVVVDVEVAAAGVVVVVLPGTAVVVVTVELLPGTVEVTTGLDEEELGVVVAAWSPPADSEDSVGVLVVGDTAVDDAASEGATVEAASGSCDAAVQADTMRTMASVAVLSLELCRRNSWKLTSCLVDHLSTVETTAESPEAVTV